MKVKISQIPLPLSSPHPPTSLGVNIPYHISKCVMTNELYIDIYHSESNTLGVVDSVGVERCIMMLIYHHSSMQTSFTFSETTCVPSLHPFLLPVTGLPTVSIILPLLQRDVPGVIQYGTFPGWLLSLNSMCLCFFLSWLDIPFPFRAEHYSIVRMDHSSCNRSATQGHLGCF